LSTLRQIMNDKSTQAGGAEEKRRGRGQSTEALLAELKGRLLEIADLGAAGAMLSWDQATYMPRGGAAARGRQGATLARLAHEKFTSAELGRLLDALESRMRELPQECDDASLIRVVRRDYDKALKVPAELLARARRLGAASYDAWTRARPANDFSTMRPFLEQSLELSREYARLFSPSQHIADPLIDEADEGMTVARVRALFDELRAELVPMARAIREQPVPSDACLRAGFAEQPQIEFSLRVAQSFGYDLERGRLDKTHHPFCTRLSGGDVRITTRVREDDLSEALFSILHEAGHALYEQGVSAELDGTPLGWGASAGVHESQSRLWENIVGRSRGFWEHFYPQLCELFPAQLGRVPLDTFYRAVNKVVPSLIRTDADEVTYNLHIMLRFDLELELLEGRLQVRDLPEAWRARYQADLGVPPADDRDGCLQDVHWYAGMVGGGFQGYTIGNILAAQFFSAATAAQPEIPGELRQGQFGRLHAWLRDNVYRHGRKFRPDELVVRASGKPTTVTPYLDYLRSKYGELYRLPPAANETRDGRRASLTPQRSSGRSSA
jgi:carboxypeptidase Taq